MGEYRLNSSEPTPANKMKFYDYLPDTLKLSVIFRLPAELGKGQAAALQSRKSKSTSSDVRRSWPNQDAEAGRRRGRRARSPELLNSKRGAREGNAVEVISRCFARHGMRRRRAWRWIAREAPVAPPWPSLSPPTTVGARAPARLPRGPSPSSRGAHSQSGLLNGP